MATKSLKAAGHQLAQTQKQLDLLQSGPFKDGDLPLFKDKIAQSGQFPLKAKKLEILQINLGYMCNQVCAHCHVDAGPDRKEIMTRETMQQCLDVIAQTGAHTLDLTGGAPEMNPDFRWFVEAASAAGVIDFIVRSNLTIIRANKKYHDLPEFFAKWPTHDKLLQASPQEIEQVIAPLGMKHVRLKRLCRMSEQFENWDGEDATALYGIGKYGSDSYRLFYKQEIPEDVGDHELKRYIQEELTL